jgi:aminomethyltransferase
VHAPVALPGADTVLGQLDGTEPINKVRVGLLALERVPVREHTQLTDLAANTWAKSPVVCWAPPSTSPLPWATCPPSHAAVGTRLNAVVRGKPVPMEVVAMPFVPTRYYRG